MNRIDNRKVYLNDICLFSRNRINVIKEPFVIKSVEIRLSSIKLFMNIDVYVHISTYVKQAKNFTCLLLIEKSCEYI